MSRRAIRYIGKKAALHPLWAVAFLLVTTVLAGWAAYERLAVEMDVATLLPKDSRIYQESLRAESLFGIGDYDFLLCVLEFEKAPDAGDDAGSTAFLQSVKGEVEEALDDQRYFRRRTERVTTRRTLLSLEHNDAALAAMLTDPDFDELESRLLPGDSLKATVASIATQLADNPATDTLAQLRSDPFEVRRILEGKTVKASGPLKNQFRDGSYLSEDGRMLLVVLWPLSPSTNLMEARSLMKFLQDTRSALYRRNPQWSGVVNIEFLGPHVESAEGTSDVRRDILMTTLVSFLGVMLLFIVAFRQPEALLFVSIPLVVGVVWTLGVASLMVPRITQVTLVFAAMLIGLGIDFSIHLYNRYLEETRAGRPAAAALSRSVMNTGPSIVAGALTTGFAFFGMALTQFQGFRELGLFGGIGVLMSLLAMAVALPPLMVALTHPGRISMAPLATLGLRKVTFAIRSYPRMTTAASLCVLAFLGIHATRVRFDTGFESLRQPSDSYIDLVDRISGHFALPSNQIMVLVQGHTLDEALAANDRVYENIAIARTRYPLLGVDSLRTTYPSPATQRANLNRFLDLVDRRIEEEARSTAAAQPAIPRDFLQEGLANLAAIRERCVLALEAGGAPIDFARTDDPAFLDVVRSFVAHDSRQNVYTMVTRLYPPSSGEWEEGLPTVFVEAVGAGLREPPQILGSAVLSTELRGLIIRDLALVVVVVLASISLYLMFHFRSIGRALLSMIPSLFALLCMLGAMRMLGMELNYLNVIAIPMTLGLSVDSGIHLLARFYEDGERNLRLAIEKTGRAIVLTSLTTVFGFGALNVASFRGIREIGLLSVIGAVCALFASLVLLPSILRLLDPRYTYRGGPGDEIG